MTPEDEAKILQDSAEGWKRANISRVKAEMQRYGISIADLQDADKLTSWPQESTNATAKKSASESRQVCL